MVWQLPYQYFGISAVKRHLVAILYLLAAISKKIAGYPPATRSVKVEIPQTNLIVGVVAVNFSGTGLQKDLFLSICAFHKVSYDKQKFVRGISLLKSPAPFSIFHKRITRLSRASPTSSYSLLLLMQESKKPIFPLKIPNKNRQSSKSESPYGIDGKIS